jgi:transposase
MPNRIRTVKTTSGATAVQIVKYVKRKTVVLTHIGSAHTADALSALKEEAEIQIEKTAMQKSLFPKERQRESPVLVINKSQYLGVRYTFIYEVLTCLFRLFDFHKLKNQILLDLVLMRIIQPVSKLESLEYLSEMFGISYKEGSLYQAISAFPPLKNTVEENIIAVAKKQFGFDFSIVFYDVTTLYFESFKEDPEGFKLTGFSKDNKSNQPQIVIGLIVTKEGFPVAYEVFEGNTFEGKTFIPTIVKFKETYSVRNLTVVADAAMISFPNVQSLIANKLSYIVGARIGNLKHNQIQEISQGLNQVDKASLRLQTERGLLVCDFSLKRYRKDKREMDKQIAKAEKLLLDKEALKRTKFIKIDKTNQSLNQDLVDKTRLLLGIKGYYTNLVTVNDETIIKQYHSLWHVEQAFRIAKSDLQMRPIYHFKKQAIEAHVLICFMALAICKYMELKTGKSTKKIVKLLKSITDARIKNKLTGEMIIMRQELSEEVTLLWKTLIQTDLSH